MQENVEQSEFIQSDLPSLASQFENFNYNRGYRLEPRMKWVSTTPLDHHSPEYLIELFRITAILQKHESWLVSHEGLPRPPNSQIAKMVTPEERARNLNEILERKEGFENRLKNRSFLAHFFGLPVLLRIDTDYLRPTGTRIFAEILDEKTGGILEVGHADFECLNDNILRVSEMQRGMHSQPRNVQQLMEKLHIPHNHEEITRFAKKLRHRESHLEDRIKQYMNSGRSRKTNPAKPNSPGVEEFVVYALRTALIQEGILTEDSDVEILHAEETFGGAEGNMAKTVNHALGKGYSEVEESTRLSLSELGFQSKSEREPGFLGNDIIRFIEDVIEKRPEVQETVLKLLQGLILSRIPISRKPSDEILKSLLESGKQNVRLMLNKLGILTVDYENTFYSYSSAFAEDSLMAEGQDPPYARRISGTGIMSLLFTKNLKLIIATESDFQ